MGRAQSGAYESYHDLYSVKSLLHTSDLAGVKAISVYSKNNLFEKYYIGLSGQIEKIERYNNLIRVVETEVFSFNQKNLLVLYNRKDHTSGSEQIISYVYDSEGRNILYKETVDREIIDQMNVSFGADSITEIHNRKGSLLPSTKNIKVLSPGSNKLVLEEYEWILPDTTSNYKASYSYNSMRRLIKETKGYGSTDFYYDQSGRLIREEFEDNTRNLLSKRYTYYFTDSVSKESYNYGNFNALNDSLILHRVIQSFKNEKPVYKEEMDFADTKESDKDRLVKGTGVKSFYKEGKLYKVIFLRGGDVMKTLYIKYLYRPQ